MDPVGFAIHRVAGRVSPALKASLQWRRARHSGDFAMRVVDTLVQPGALVLDIGGAWGLYTARLARLVGESGKVQVFEPNPVYERPLRELARRLPQVEVHAVGLSDGAGQATLQLPHIGGRTIHEMATLSPPEHSEWTVTTARVAVDRLDRLVRPDRPVSFVKCDVEGHELKVLAGGAEVLAGRPTMLMEIEQRHHDEPIQKVFAYVESLGYDLYAVRPSGIVPVAEFDVAVDQTAHLMRKPSLESGEPADYVKDFLLLPTGTAPDERLLSASRR